jgi:ribokinase
MKEIVVVGSSNTDMVIRASHIPAPGETILGGEFFMNAGGKGANQAVAAARLGGKVTFIAKVGKDIFGDKAIKGFINEGINTDYIAVDEFKPSGIALITVDDKAENSIVVASGANNTIVKQDIDKAIEQIKKADIILLQLEIPVNIVEYVAETGKQFGKKVILNPAPAQKLSDNIYNSLYIITPNETEAEILTGIKVTDIQSAEKAAKVLRDKGVEIVIITMGEKGAYILTDKISELIPGRKVKAIDTTAAGDTFNGALAVAIADNKEIKEAVKFANTAASISVTKLGAQSSAPYLKDIKAVQ